MCKEDKLTIQKGIEIITSNIDDASSTIGFMSLFMDMCTEKIVEYINDNNAKYVKETVKELLQELQTMKNDISFIEKKLIEIRGQVSFYRIIRASHNIDRLLKKFKKGK